MKSVFKCHSCSAFSAPLISWRFVYEIASASLWLCAALMGGRRAATQRLTPPPPSSPLSLFPQNRFEKDRRPSQPALHTPVMLSWWVDVHLSHSQLFMPLTCISLISFYLDSCFVFAPKLSSFSYCAQFCWQMLNFSFWSCGYLFSGLLLLSFSCPSKTRCPLLEA